MLGVMFLFESIEKAPGAGPKRKTGFERLGIERIIDLIFHLPRRYEDRRIVTKIGSLRRGQLSLVTGEVGDSESKMSRNKVSVNKLWISDETGKIPVTFFNQDYILDRASPGRTIHVYGTVESFRGEVGFNLKEIDFTAAGKTIGRGKVLPFYPASRTTPQWYLRKLIRDLLFQIEKVRYPFPEYPDLPSFPEAIRFVHAPRNLDEPELGRRRLAMDELTAVRLCVEKILRSREPVPREALGERIDLTLPFELTDDQKVVSATIMRDLEGDHPMRRLVEGDVGSGKTVLALLAAAKTAERGRKTLFMAPTEILGEQHYRSWCEILEEAGIGAWLLTGSTKGEERKKIQKAAASDEPAVFFGTHALIAKKAKFSGVGLVVVDEQQRFGVGQREEILKKGTDAGKTPDLLILTATPIPRTLAMTLYGDLEISALRSRLPGREPVKTIHLREGERARLMPHLKEALKKDERVYIVYPLIEEGEELGIKNAKEQFKKIAKAFPAAGAALLTGKMKSKEKEATMRAFRDGEASIMVCTSVVEVGIDVPEATVMIIEHAENFGLAQLHQLRGRVGRSSLGGVCILTTADELSEYAEERMNVLVNCSDGFELAEEDLRLRGPGEVLGERQSGGSELKVAQLGIDFGLIPTATEHARSVLDEDPSLKEHEFLKGLAVHLRGAGAGKL